MKYFLTLDVGTTAVKAGLFTQYLDSIAISIREYELLTPRTDYVELDSEVYWENACAAIGDALTKAGIDPEDIVALTCTTQGETLIPIDENGHALHHAIVWLDGRAKREAAWICERIDRLSLYQRTGLPEMNGYTPLAKLLWIKNNLPELYAMTAKFLLLEDYLIFRLSGQFVSNPALMCTTGYLDIQTDELWDDVLTICGLDKQKIPPIRACAQVIGGLTAEAAAALGLPQSVLVTTGAMDQVASAIGSGNVVGEIVTETTGTCQGIAATVEKEMLAQWSPVTYYRHAIQGKLLKIVINQTAGIAYKWFRNEFCQDLAREGDDTFRLMDELAAHEPVRSRGVSMFAHMTGMQFPVVDENARGVFFGVGLDTTKGCFLRAIMEGVGYMLRESMEKMGISPSRVISLGGGARSQLWCQMKANICGMEFAVLENEETTSLGAAILGSVAVGMFDSIEAASGRLSVNRVFVPNLEEQKAYENGYAEYIAMYRQFEPLFKMRKEA